MPYKPTSSAKPMTHILKIKQGFKGERSLTMPEMVLNIAQEDPILQTLHVTDIGYYPHAIYHYRNRPTPIDQYVLIYCVKGSGKYYVGGKHFEVKENQYFILPANKPHAYASNNEDPWTIYWIHFRGTLAPYYGEDAIEPSDVSASVNSRIADRNNIFEDIFLTLSDGYTIDNLRYTTSLLHFYLGSLRYLPIYRKCHKVKEENTDNHCIVVNAALKYMEENMERQITLKDLATYTGYSVSHFSSIFNSSTGHSPLNYFNMLKVKKACELLDTTNMKITQISGKVGIDDPLYFSRIFKKIVGISPKQYREKDN